MREQRYVQEKLGLSFNPPSFNYANYIFSNPVSKSFALLNEDVSFLNGLPLTHEQDPIIWARGTSRPQLWVGRKVMVSASHPIPWQHFTPAFHGGDTKCGRCPGAYRPSTTAVKDGMVKADSEGK
ncbi:hypothetical protein VNO77_39039 [Canavalia gladiata]|uniref:Uncharacterized protein n=1 Tax=Canavalia gladiata TaxID=3824 RepID=A0AAN9KCX1_CANGL